MPSLLVSWRKAEVLSPEAREKAELARTMKEIGIARFFGRYMSGILSNDRLAMEVMNEHVREAERQGPVVRFMKALFS